MVNTKLKRAKVLSFFLSIFILILTGCEGFFTDNGLDEKIRAAIDYANAPTSSFWISGDQTMGTITPYGKISYKPTDYQNIKFKLKPEYEFLGWNFRYEEIQSGEKYTREITNKNWWKDYIEIVNDEDGSGIGEVSEPTSSGEITYTLQIKFIKAEENMLIEPICALKPILKSWSGQLGEIQSRNGSLSFVFNTRLDLDKSIYFSDKEISALGEVTPLKNGLDKIYGYQKGDEVFFKNIEIKYKNRNINSSFKDFRYKDDTNTLIIAPDSAHPFDIVGDFADIEIIFKEGIKSSDGASMTESKAYVNINKYSDDRSVITVATNTSKTPETVSPVTSTLYLQEQKTAGFTQSEKTQFLYWEVTSAAAYPDSKDKVYVQVDEENPLKITYWGMQKIDSTEEVTISAVYEARPSYEWNFNSSTVYPKDSDIKIKFDKEINLESFKEGFKIAIDGNSVKSNFDEPVLDSDNKTVIIRSNKNNRLSISGNKTVTLTIPEDLYYSVTENDGNTYKVYLGKEHNPSYTVNAETAEKAYVKFIVPSEAGELVKYDASGVKALNIGDALSLTYKEKSGWQFIEWQIEGNTDNAIEVVKSETDNLTYTFNARKLVGSAAEPVTVTAVAKERLKIVKVNPVTTGSEAKAQDTEIDIYFNHEPTLDLCKQKLSIKCNGVNVKDCFPTTKTDYWTLTSETLEGKTVYRLHIKADKSNRISVSGLATVELSLDANFYYSDAGTPVYIGGEGWTHEYKVNEETTDKAYLSLATESTKGSLRTAFDAAGYSIGRKINVTFVPTDDYEFLYWNTIDNTSIAIEDKFQKTTNITILDTGNVSISAECAPRLKVNENGVTLDSTPDSNGNYPKDSDITIAFNHNLTSGINLKKYLSITCGSLDVYSKYDYQITDNKLILKTKQEDRIQISNPQNLKIYIAGDYYYEYSDSLVSSRIGMNNSDERIIKLGPATKEKAKVKVLRDSVYGSDSGVIQNADGGDFSIGEADYNKDTVFTLTFIPASGFEFICWDITDSAENLNITGVNDKTATVTVLNSNTGTAEIKPVCTPKLSVTEVKVNGVAFDTAIQSYPKDSSYSFTFNQAPSSDINLKNYVTVRCGSTDVSSKYTYSLSGDTLNITADPENRLQFSSNQSLTVSIDKNFYYTHSSGKNISFNTSYNKTITIDPTTNDKATVSVTNDDASAGTIKDGTSGNNFTTDATQYSKDQTLKLNYDLNSGYEFINWEVTGITSNVQLSSTTSPATTVTIVNTNAATGSDVGTTIKAVAAPKLAVQTITVNGEEFSATGTYPKDSVIEITFNKTIPSGLMLSKYISLNCNNIPGVYDKYNVSISGSKITLTPNSRLDIPSTKPLVLTIDQSLYYEYSSSKNITLASSYTAQIQLTTETVQKANVQVTNGTTAGGTIKDAVAGTNFTTNATDYSKDQTFTLNYDLNSGYEFINWTVTGTTSNVQLSSTTSTTTTVTIIGSTTGTATIKANVAEKLKLSSMTVNGSDFSDTATTKYPKDSVIVLTFNKTIPTGLLLSDYITLSCGNITGVYDYYTVTSSGTKITLTPKTRLGITAEATLNLTVKSSLYYQYTANRNITLASNVTKAIPLNTTTVDKAKVKFAYDTRINSGSYGTLSATTGGSVVTINQEADYSKDQTIDINFTPAEGYKFVKWDITSGPSGVAQIQNIMSASTTIKITNSSTNVVTIKPLCAKKLTASLQVNGADFNPDTTYPKDSSYSIIFNEAPATNASGKSIKRYTGSVASYYTVSLNNKTLSYTSSSRFSNVVSGEVITITLTNSTTNGFYYTDTITGSKIYLEETFEKNIKIDSSTRNQTNLQVSWDEAYGTVKDASGNIFTMSSTSYSLDTVFSLNYVPNDDYEFVCWEIDTTSSVTTNASSNPKTTSDNIVKLENYDKNTVTVKVIGSGTSKIKPYFVPKLKVNSITVNGSSLKNYKMYPKDSEIVLTFSEELDSTSVSNIGNKAYLYFEKTGKQVSTTSTITTTTAQQYCFQTKYSSTDKQITFSPPVLSGYENQEFSKFRFLPLNKEGEESSVNIKLGDLYYSVTKNSITKRIPLKYEEISYDVDYKSLTTFSFQVALYNGACDNTSYTITPKRADNRYYFGEEISVSYRNSFCELKPAQVNPGSTIAEGWQLSGFHIDYIQRDEYISYMYYSTFRILNLWSKANGLETEKYYFVINGQSKPVLRRFVPTESLANGDLPCDAQYHLNFTTPIDPESVCLEDHEVNGKTYKKTISVITPNVEWVRDVLNDVYCPFDYMDDTPSGYKDITNYFEITRYLDYNGNYSDSIYIIKPKAQIRKLFAEYEKERIPIFFLMNYSEVWTKATGSTESQRLYDWNLVLYEGDSEYPTSYKYGLYGFDLDDEGWERDINYITFVLEDTIVGNIRYEPYGADWECYAYSSGASEHLTPNLKLINKDDFTAHPEAIIPSGGQFGYFSELSAASRVYGNWSEQGYYIDGYYKLAVTPLYKWTGSGRQYLTSPTVSRLEYKDNIEDIYADVKFDEWGVPLNTFVRIDFTIYHPSFSLPYEVSYYVYYGSF